MDRCYKLHVYPLGYEPKQRSQAQHTFAKGSGSNKPQFSKDRSQPFRPSTIAIVNSSPMILSNEHVRHLIAYLSTQLNVKARHQRETSSTPSHDSASSLVSHVHGTKSSVPPHSSLSCSRSFKNSWILDTGVTHHICCNVSLFTHFEPINAVSMTLPNEQYVTTT